MLVAVACGGPWLWWRYSFRTPPPERISELDWPPLFRSLVDSAGLTSDERAQVGVWRHRQMIDHSCVLRMPASEQALAWVAKDLPRIDENQLYPGIWGYGVTRDEFGPTALLDVYASSSRAVENTEEFTAFHDKGKRKLVVLYRFVF